jgi:hypothetical protein
MDNNVFTVGRPSSQLPLMFIKPWIRIRAAHRLLAERRWCCPGHAPNDPFQKPALALDQVGVGGFQHRVEMVAQFGEEGYANGSWAGTPPEHHRKWLQISELYDPHRSNTGVAPEQHGAQEVQRLKAKG